MTDPDTLRENENQHIFIVGCPRSGTTAMWKLLSTSSKIIIGVERYAHRIFPPFSLTPELFERKRFLSLQDGDTFYDDLAQFNPYYSECITKFGGISYIGDKIPKLYEYFDELEKNFSNAKIIFMFRNIFDVAASYKCRAEDKDDTTWSRESGVDSAISDWRASISSFKEHKFRLDILPVCYESFFYSKAGLSKVTSFLKIDQGELQETYQNLVYRGKQLEEMRSRDLTTQEVFNISMQAPFGGYREIVDIWESF